MASQNTTSRPCIIISGFGAIGKSWLTDNKPDEISGYKVLDLDSSSYSKYPNGDRRPDFKEVYFQEVKKHMASNTILLVSTHPEIRDALAEASVNYALVYPSDGLKDEWTRRFSYRGTSKYLIEYFRSYWFHLLNDCKKQTHCEHFVLQEEEYLSNIIEVIIQRMDTVQGAN